jgi:uncharacterized protein with LGFP repeats
VPPWQIPWLACTADVAIDDTTAAHSAPCLVPGCNTSIEQHYWQLGGPNTGIGSATSVQVPTPDGIGEYQLYSNGAIYWSPTTGACEMVGFIYNKWVALGGLSGGLGYPATDNSITSDGFGRYNLFQNGSIYWTPQTGAWELHGAINFHWRQLGAERSGVGYPVSDETGASDGIGRYNVFQNGVIYWTPQLGPAAVQGAIYQHYAKLGWQVGVLGYPTTDELPVGDGVGRYSKFQNGAIYWTDLTGAWALHGPILLAYLSISGPASRLGYPVSDVVPNSSGALATFQYGYITWDAATNKTIVHYA